MRLLLISALLFGALSAPTLLSAQTSDQELATYYYQNGEYEKAILYFEDIYKDQPSETNFRFYLNSLKEVEQLDEAIKLIKKHQKKNKDALGLYIEMGVIQERLGEVDEAKKNYEEAISQVGKSRNQITDLAKAFSNADKPQLALETYEKGKKDLNGSYPFSYEIASIYGELGDHERMIEEYMNLLEYNKGYLRSVQNNLNRTLDFTSDTDPRVDVLKTALLRKVQQNPESDVFYDMLIWLFTQRKEFNAAFVQTKAIDKRMGEDGRRLIALASLCTNNEEYDIAAKCYAYIVNDKGPDTRYYNTARTMELVSAKKALMGQFSPPKEEVAALDARFAGVITDLGPGKEAARLTRERALLNAYYLGESETAITLLDEAINSPGVDKTLKAQCKLDMGDILLANGYIWDASLYYSQVEKDFKEDVLGFDAKYRNAKISYYAGDFDWAQAQLDVLKASTSKLISNDALDLSLLITDNLALDTIYEPMEMFARADLLTFQNRFEPAIATLDSITRQFPGHTLTDEIIYQKAQIAYKKGDFEGAATLLEEVLTFYFDDILADNALFDLAEMNERIFKDEAKAMELYEQLFVNYPASLYVIEARKRFRALRGDVPVDQEVEGGREIKPIEN